MKEDAAGLLSSSCFYPVAEVTAELAEAVETADAVMADLAETAAVSFLSYSFSAAAVDHHSAKKQHKTIRMAKI